MEYITSIKDERIIQARELTTTKRCMQLGKCLLEDKNAIEWAQEAGLPIEHVFVQDKYESDSFVQELYHKGVACYLVSDGIMRKIIEASYSVPFVAVARLKPGGIKNTI